MKRNEIVTVLRGFVDKYSFEGSPETVIKFIENLPNVARRSFPDNLGVISAHRFSIALDTEYDYDGRSYEIFNLQCFRYETDQEFLSRKENLKIAEQDRLRRKKIQDEAVKKRRKTMYEKLRKEFEK